MTCVGRLVVRGGLQRELDRRPILYELPDLVAPMAQSRAGMPARFGDLGAGAGTRRTPGP